MKAKIAFKVAGLNQAASLALMIAPLAAPTPKAMTAGISQALLPHKVDHSLCQYLRSYFVTRCTTVVEIT